VSDKTMYEVVPNCWTITHPEMGGPLEVVAASAYDALLEERDVLRAEVKQLNTLVQVLRNREAGLE